jgi:hypothetical protein
MKSKYDGNDLLDFLERNPMEMMEFMDAHRRQNPIWNLFIKFMASLPWA